MNVFLLIFKSAAKAAKKKQPHSHGVLTDLALLLYFSDSGYFHLTKD